MGATSIWHWIIVLLVVLLLFGKGRIAPIMGDIGKGMRSLREGLKGEEEKPAEKNTIAANKDQD